MAASSDMAMYLFEAERRRSWICICLALRTWLSRRACSHFSTSALIASTSAVPLNVPSSTCTIPSAWRCCSMVALSGPPTMISGTGRDAASSAMFLTACMAGTGTSPASNTRMCGLTWPTAARAWRAPGTALERRPGCSLSSRAASAPMASDATTSTPCVMLSVAIQLFCERIARDSSAQSLPRSASARQRLAIALQVGPRLFLEWLAPRRPEDALSP